MSDKKINELQKLYEIGSKEWEELSLREMINSCWCYGSDCYHTHYITDYFKDGRLKEKRVWEIVEDQLNYLNNNCSIRYSTYTDSDGIVYNSIIENEVA